MLIIAKHYHQMMIQIFVIAYITLLILTLSFDDDSNFLDNIVNIIDVNLIIGNACTFN